MAQQLLPPTLVGWGGCVGSGLGCYVLLELLQTACDIAGAGMESSSSEGISHPSIVKQELY